MEKVTIKEIVPIWWAWQWRAMVATLVGTLVFSFLIGLIGGILGFSKESIYILTNLVSLAVTIYASLYFFAYIFNMRFKKYKLCIMEDSEHYAKKAALI